MCAQNMVRSSETPVAPPIESVNQMRLISQTRAKRSALPPAGDHKAAMNRHKSMTDTIHK